MDKLLRADGFFHRTGHRGAVSEGRNKIVDDLGLDYRIFSGIEMKYFLGIGDRGKGDSGGDGKFPFVCFQGSESKVPLVVQNDLSPAATDLQTAAAGTFPGGGDELSNGIAGIFHDDADFVFYFDIPLPGGIAEGLHGLRQAAEPYQNQYGERPDSSSYRRPRRCRCPASPQHRNRSEADTYR